MLNVQNASGRSRLALSRYCVIDSATMEQACEIYRRMAVALRFNEVRGKAAFSARLHCLRLGPLVLSGSENSASLRVTSARTSDTYLLSIPLMSEASAESTVGKVTTPLVRRKSGVLCAPGQVSEVRLESHFQALQLIVPRPYLLDAMQSLTGLPSRDITFRTRLDLDSPHTAPLMRLLKHVVAEADQEHPEFAAHGESERLAEALVFRLLLSQPHSQSALFATAARAAEPPHVRCAAEYMDTHFERSVTMAELARVTGISARSLQVGFRKYRGCSPLDFVRARRLERARVMLVTNDELVTVSEVAHRAGIRHLGRFSVRYRERFGESPTQTLARRWKRTG